MSPDDLLSALAGAIELDESTTSIVNPYRMTEFKNALRLVCEVFAGQKDVTVEYQLHEPYQSAGYIRIAGPKLSIMDTEKFYQAVSLASNLCVTPKTNGSVEFDLTFHELTMHLPED